MGMSLKSRNIGENFECWERQDGWGSVSCAGRLQDAHSKSETLWKTLHDFFRGPWSAFRCMYIYISLLPVHGPSNPLVSWSLVTLVLRLITLSQTWLAGKSPKEMEVSFAGKVISIFHPELASSPLSLRRCAKPLPILCVEPQISRIGIQRLGFRL